MVVWCRLTLQVGELVEFILMDWGERRQSLVGELRGSRSGGTLISCCGFYELHRRFLSGTWGEGRRRNLIMYIGVPDGQSQGGLKDSFPHRLLSILLKYQL